LETEIAPFAELPTAALIEKLEPDSEEVGFEVELSTLGLEETFPLVDERVEEIFSGQGPKTGRYAPDPADLAISRGQLEIESSEDTDGEHAEGEQELSWASALASLDMSTAEEHKSAVRKLAAESYREPIEEVMEVMELGDAAADDHAISRAFRSFDVADRPQNPPAKAPAPAREAEPEPLPSDALMPVDPEPSLKRNIVEVHRPGPAAPTQFLSNADGEPAIFDADALVKLPEIVRERGGQTPLPALQDPKKKR
jgi:hypothetical protein